MFTLIRAVLTLLLPYILYFYSCLRTFRKSLLLFPIFLAKYQETRDDLRLLHSTIHPVHFVPIALAFLRSFDHRLRLYDINVAMYGIFMFTYGMFDRVVHDDVIFSYWQPGAERDDVTVPKWLWALPC